MVEPWLEQNQDYLNKHLSTLTEQLKSLRSEDVKIYVDKAVTLAVSVGHQVASQMKAASATKVDSGSNSEAKGKTYADKSSKAEETAETNKDK